jgi:hypothetical protein
MKIGDCIVVVMRVILKPCMLQQRSGPEEREAEEPAGK